MFEFASGVINVWEKMILSPNDQERMLKAPDRASAFLVLFDTDLGELATITQDTEIIFESDLADLKQRLIKILDNRGELICFLFLQFDAWNLKIALKNKFFPDRLRTMEPFVCSLVSYEKLAEKLADGRKMRSSRDIGPECGADVSNGYLEEMIDLSFKELTAGVVDSMAIEEAVDRAYFQLRLMISGKLSSFLVEVVKTEIDLANIKSLLNGRDKGSGFLAGGNLNEVEVQKLLDLREGEIVSDLKKFLEILNLSFLFEEFAATKSEIILERGLQSFVSRRIFEKERATGSGMEKVLAFFYKKLNSYFNIRLILFAKENNLPLEEIEGLLLPI